MLCCTSKEVAIPETLTILTFWTNENYFLTAVRDERANQQLGGDPDGGSIKSSVDTANYCLLRCLLREARKAVALEVK